MATFSGGYDYKFVNTPPDRLVCNICYLPSRDPYLTTCCGHVFCKSCLDYVQSPVTVSKGVCPVCREKEFVAYINKQLDREIRNLHVTCTNTERGCEWQGELNDIYNHLGNSDGCQFEDVKCSNECGKMLQRQYLTSHVETECAHRKVDCQYCHITGEHQFIEGEHKEQCPKLPLSCPNKCEIGSVLREDMEAHRKECPLEMIQCEYHNVGCEERMMRKRKREHEEEKMEEHLSLTKHSLTQEVADTKLQLVGALEKIDTLNLVLHQALGLTSYFSGAGPMTSLQQPITGKVSTTTPGMQPIMSKLLTEIANTSPVGSTSPSSTGGAAASTSVGGVEVETEMNTSLAVMSGTGLEMSSGTSSEMPSGINTGLNTGANAGRMSTSGMGLGINTGINSVVGPGGVGSGMNTGSGGFQSRVPGMNPGIGMPSSMSGIGMGPSSSISMPTGMQQPPDIYPTSSGVGGAPLSAVVGQNAQQTQIIWIGSIEMSEMRDGLREMRTVRCSIVSKVSSKSILKPELWPPKIIIQPYPRTIYQSVLAQLKSRSIPITTTMVTFNFLEPVASFNTLKMLASAEQQQLGIVQLLGTQPMCPVKSIVLSWNNQQFVGYVPSEQDKFLMVFRQILQELQQGGSGGVPHSSGLPPSLQLPSNLPPKIQQLLERFKPEDQKIILEKVKQMRQFQQQQAQIAVGGGGVMVQPMRLQQASQPKGIIGQGNMIQPMGGGRQMQSQTIQIHSQPMGIQQAGQMQTAQPMGLQQGQYQNQPVGMPQSNPSTDRP
ncbi:uncharacterized protein [Dysidea avara]|uniref:uncharacterized protein isoform X2 n=1 Tax=Dysidea avara TaxID=196820 RepID=UPI00332267FC